MKVRVEISEDAENEIIIRAKALTAEVEKIERAILKAAERTNLVFYKDGAEYYLPIEGILFFGTGENTVQAHTETEVFTVKEKLYRLEEILPHGFVRASKSTLINTDKIYSINKNITSFSTVSFQNTHKQVFVSRNYYKTLKERINERRNNYEG